MCDAIKDLDGVLPPFKTFMPGIGPYGEPQLCKHLVHWMNKSASCPFDDAVTKREPDILIPDRWAIEVKLARPYGDNGKEAEHWSQNLLHPYPGNVSSIADAMKLQTRNGVERRAIVVFGYEHKNPEINLDPLFAGFELLCAHVCGLRLSERVERSVEDLRHPVHARCRVVTWEVDP